MSHNARQLRLSPRRLIPGLVLVAAVIGAGAGPAVAAPKPSAGGGPGFVYGWGEQFLGSLGPTGATNCNLQSQTFDATPVAIALPGGAAASAVDAGNDFGFAQTADGHAYGWGNDSANLLGFPPPTYQGNHVSGVCSPTEVPAFSGDTAGTFERVIPVGAQDTIFQASGGIGYSSGFENGLGAGAAALFAANGDNLNTAPIADLLPANATDVSSSGTETLAVTPNGQVVAGGDGSQGDLGPNATSSGNGYVTTVPLPSGEVASRVAAGPSFGLALTSDGKVYGWGADASGQMGDGRSGTTSGVVQIPLPSGVTFTQIAAGGLPFYNPSVPYPGFGLALSSTGDVYAWGDDESGEQADGTTSSTPEAPHKISGLSGITQIAAGQGVGFALAGNGTLYAWGTSTEGLVGNGTTSPQLTPAPVSFPAGSAVQSISATNGSNAFAVVQPSQPAVSAQATNVTGETAQLDGSVLVPASTTVTGSPTCQLAYSTSSSMSSPTTVPASCTNITSNAVTGFSAHVTGLRLTTTYYLQAQATIDGTAYTSPVTSFTTTNGIEISTSPATAVATHGAQLNGVLDIDPGVATSATCQFAYSTNPSIPTGSPTIGATCTASGVSTLTATPGGLNPDTTYYYEAQATVDGHLYSAPQSQSFTTLIPAPAVSTGTLSAIGQTSAQVAGTATYGAGDNLPGSVCGFEYGEDPTLSSGTVTVNATTPAYGVCDSGTVAFSVALSGLHPQTTYYVRAFALVGLTGAHRTYGPIRTFQTLAPPPPPPSPSPSPGGNPPPPANGPASGPAGAGPAPGATSTNSLSPTKCTNETRVIGAAGGAFQVTGCIYGDNDGHYLVKGTFTLNGLTISPQGSGSGAKPAAVFACTDGNEACLTLLSTYTESSEPLFTIDIPDSKVAGSTAYRIATGSTTLFAGSLQSPVSAGLGAGASFAPTVSGQDPNSGPAIYLAGGASGLGSLHGLPIISPVTILPQDTSGAEIQLSLKVPFSGVTGSAVLHVSPDGSEDLRGLSLDVPVLEIPDTPINLGDVHFSFNLDTDTWEAGANMLIPGLDKTIGVSILITHGLFNGASGSAGNLDIPLPETAGAVRLDSLGAGFRISPASVFGTIGLTGGPSILGHAAITFDGGFDMAFGDSITVGPIADIIPQPITYSDVPFYFAMHGQESLGGLIPIGGSNFNLLAGPGFTPVITYSGGIGPLGGPGCDLEDPSVSASCTPQGYSITVGNVTLAQLKLVLNGVLDGYHFNAEGSGSVSVLGAGFSGSALVSTSGVVACASLSSFHLPFTARSASASSPTSPGAQQFASDVVAQAQPRALVALSRKRRNRRLTQARADLRRAQRQARALAASTRRAIAAILRADRRANSISARAARAAVSRSAAGYRRGRGTQGFATSLLLAAAVRGSGALQADGSTASNALQRLRSTVTTQLQALAQRISADQTEIGTLTAHGASIAADEILAQQASFASFFQGIGNDIKSGFQDAWNGIKGVAASAARDVANEVTSVAETIGGLAGNALTEFEDGMQTFGNDLAQLGKDAEAGLEQFAQDVKNAAIMIAGDLQNLFNGQIGVGYHWGGTPTFYPTGGCSLGAYVDEAGLQPARAALMRSDVAAVREHAIAASTFHLTGGGQFTVLKFAGQGAPPLVTLTGPGGLRLTTPASGLAAVEDNGRAFVNRDPTTNTTMMLFPPATGTYVAALAAGSVAVTRTSRAGSLPQPSVSARVTGHGTHRVLHWSARRIPGQTLQFSVHSSAGTVVVTTTGAARGAARFAIPAGLPGLGSVLVQVREDGFDRQAFQVATFPAPVAAPPRSPRGLSVVRHGSLILIHWRSGGSRIAAYRVLVSTTGGVNDTVETQTPRLAIPNVTPAAAVAVQVIAIDAFGQRSAPAIRALSGRGLSACRAPGRITLVLRAPGRLRIVAALIDGRPVAVRRRPGRSLVIPLAGTTGRRAVLTVQGRTTRGRKVSARHVIALCAGTIPGRLTLRLK